MIQIILGFDYAIAAVVIAIIASLTILIIWRIRARDSRTALAVEIGELKSRLSWHVDETRGLRHRLDLLEKGKQQ